MAQDSPLSVVRPLPEPLQFVSGRRLAIQCLDRVMEEPASCHLLAEAFRAMLSADPISFFRVIILPTLPKESLIIVEQGNASQLRIELIPKPPELQPSTEEKKL